jgi:hypothetical protein
MPLTKISVFSSDLRRQLKVVWLQDKIILILFLVGLFFNLVLYLSLVLGIVRGSEPVVLHYSVYFGIDLIGPWPQLYFMPAVGTLLFLVNLTLALFFYKKEKVASYLFSGATAVLEALLLVGGILLVWINR